MMNQCPVVLLLGFRNEKLSQKICNELATTSGMKYVKVDTSEINIDVTYTEPVSLQSLQSEPKSGKRTKKRKSRKEESIVVRDKDMDNQVVAAYIKEWEKQLKGVNMLGAIIEMPHECTSTALVALLYYFTRMCSDCSLTNIIVPVDFSMGKDKSESINFTYTAIGINANDDEKKDIKEALSQMIVRQCLSGSNQPSFSFQSISKTGSFW